MVVALKKLVMPLSDDDRKRLTIRAFIWIQYHQSVTERQTGGFAITISRSACIALTAADCVSDWSIIRCANLSELCRYVALFCLFFTLLSDTFAMLQVLSVLN